MVYFLVLESLVAFVTLIEINRNKFGFIEFGGSFFGFQDSFWGYTSSVFTQLGPSNLTMLSFSCSVFVRKKHTLVMQISIRLF